MPKTSSSSVKIFYPKHNREQIIEAIQEALPRLQEQLPLKLVALFGSYAKGNYTVASDIDLLVELDADISLLGFVELKLELQEALGRNVDLVEYSTIKPRLRDVILRQQEIIL